MTPKTAIRAEAEGFFTALLATGAQPVEADLLLPAETLLDLYGEDIRARAYVTQDPVRGEMMLRPDFTVPVVQAHMEHGAEPARYCYMGEVFRQQVHLGPRQSEYVQVGYEVFDGTDPLAADAEVFALFQSLLAPLGLRAATGDIGILRAAVMGLNTSDRRKSALLRHLWRPRRFRALLDRFGGRAPVPEARQKMLARMAAGEDLLAGLVQTGQRGEDEVQERLAALAEDAALPPISAEEISRLETVLALRDTCPSALRRLQEMATTTPSLTTAVERLAMRIDRLAACGITVESLEFEASYGRTTMEYYDGFVFGFYAEGEVDMPPIATGGRYDALTAVLGQGRSIPAVGGVLRPGLTARLRGAL
ncbi:ATP phosphoribosyltransferase regulatory subunit [Thioclava sp. FR2]|uniref:ATP phosphoribosyltransferase regulatory subunit n=1 Tax=Thioclava sp. FR2 TaxID=3445780 RepID=UPI003EB7BBA0